MKDIGKILKNARENKEYTQKQVMELTGIHRKSLSGYENNVAEPDLSTFATLANLYGISADEALEIGEPDPSVSLLRFEFQVLSLFKELDAKHQEELLIQITALVRYLNAKNMVPHFFPFKKGQSDQHQHAHPNRNYRRKYNLYLSCHQKEKR